MGLCEDIDGIDAGVASTAEWRTSEVTEFEEGTGKKLWNRRAGRCRDYLKDGVRSVLDLCRRIVQEYLAGSEDGALQGQCGGW